MENPTPMEAVAPPPAQPVNVPGEDVAMAQARGKRRDVEMTEKRASTRLLEAQAKKAAQEALRKEREEQARLKREESRRKKQEREQEKKQKEKEKEEATKAAKREKENQRHENFKRALESHAGPLLKDVYHEARQDLLLAKIPKKLQPKKRGRSSSSKSSSASMDSEEKGKIIDEMMEQKVKHKIDKQIDDLEREKHRVEEKLIEHHEKLREGMKYLNKDSKTPINEKYNETIKAMKEPYDEAIKKLRGLRNLALSGIKHKQYGQKTEEDASSGLAQGMQNMFAEGAPAVAAPVVAAATEEQAGGRRRRRDRGGCGCSAGVAPSPPSPILYKRY